MKKDEVEYSMFPAGQAERQLLSLPPLFLGGCCSSLHRLHRSPDRRQKKEKRRVSGAANALHEKARRGVAASVPLCSDGKFACAFACARARCERMSGMCVCLSVSLSFS